VRVSQVVSRKDDLALALRASRIRLVAPIPGKAAIGIEVPNRIASTISLRTILEEIDPTSLPGVLPLVLGRDTRGRAYAARLEQMPHLLVAGTTGSGKSVFLNGVLLSLLLRRTPDEMRLLLIDPKMLELTPYDGIPHLICPVVTEAKQAARMLAWAVGEMERRYRHMAALGVRNLDGYRDKARAAGPDGGVPPMPHLVILVDELADLMLTLQNEIEGPVMRLAQMARAVGIHLVLATQRPSVDVITGVIKANFPARVAFQVASKVDSRTILDANGAEDLLGRGDMLFLPPGKAESVRVHGAYAGERDAAAVADFLRAQPPAPPLFREADLAREEGDPEIEDDLFEDALRLIVQHRQASVSFLQRRLKVGYSRAGRLMDILEHAGAVGPQDGSKTREVLADEIFLERMRARDEQDAGSRRS
jgi:DNA segregation ATPase FtsK/SpoIIIE, S-DNA-T family